MSLLMVGKLCRQNESIEGYFPIAKFNRYQLINIILLYSINIPYMHLNSCCGAWSWYYRGISFNMLRSRQNDRHFIDDIFKRIFLNEIVWNSITISLKLVPKGPINNIPALVKTMAWRQPGDRPLFESMMVSLLRIYASLGLIRLWQVMMRRQSDK